jgi:hypothetical protein
MQKFVNGGNFTTKICSNMPANKKVRVTFKGELGSPTSINNMDWWGTFFFGPQVYDRPNIRVQSFYDEFAYETVVPADGRVEIRYGYTACRVNYPVAECMIKPSGQPNMVESELIEFSGTLIWSP